MCRAVGKVSLELWDRFTWSLGWSRSSPAWRLPHRAMTSLQFMLVWVPLPVCHTARGEVPRQLPGQDGLRQAPGMRSCRRSSSFPSRWLAAAQASFKVAKARMRSRGIFSSRWGSFPSSAGSGPPTACPRGRPPGPWCRVPCDSPKLSAPFLVLRRLAPGRRAVGSVAG